MAVTLFENSPCLGGLAAAWQLGDVVWDRHYHVILNSDSYLRAILRELELEKEIQWRTTRTGFYVDSKFYSLSNSFEFLRFPPLSLPDKIRLGATIFYASRITDWRALERISAQAWLERCSGRRVVEKIWLPLLRSKLGDNYRETSAAFIWSTIARMYAARRSGMKREMFGYVPGGYSRIIEHFTRALNSNRVDLRLGRSVRRVFRSEAERANPAGLTIECDGAGDETFDNVVLTAASPIAARCCPQLTTAEKDQLSAVRYQGIICASVLLKRPLNEFYVTNITDSGLPFTAVVEMSALVDRKHFNGNALIYLPKYVPSDSRDFELTDDQVQERFIEGLERMYPQFSRTDVLSFRISRVKYLLPISILNYSSLVPPVTTSVPGLHILNSAHIVNGTLNVNETVRLAEFAARQFAPENERFLQPLEHEPRETNCQPFAGCRQ
jgi:protoporphyrinogen oxidase